MTEKIEDQEELVLHTTYPIHYHGYIHMYDPEAIKKTPDQTLTNQLIKQYGEIADELGIG